MPLSGDIVTHTIVRIFIFAIVGSGLVTWTKLRNRWHISRAKDWPTAEATIHSGTVQAVPQSTYFRAEVSYSYFVDEYRSGTYDRVFANEDKAYLFVKHVRDRKITIRYKPSKPDISAIDEDSLQNAEGLGILENI